MIKCQNSIVKANVRSVHHQLPATASASSRLIWEIFYNVVDLSLWQVAPDNLKRLLEFSDCLRLCFKLSVSFQHCTPHMIVYWVRGLLFFAAPCIEKLQLSALLHFWPSYDAAVHWKFKPFMNSELQFERVLLFYHTNALSHSLVAWYRSAQNNQLKIVSKKVTPQKRGLTPLVTGYAYTEAYDNVIVKWNQSKVVCNANAHMQLAPIMAQKWVCPLNLALYFMKLVG